VIKQVPSLSVVTVAAIAAAVLSAPAAATLAQEQSLESRFLNGSHQDQWKNPYNSGDSLNPDGDSLNPDPFLSGSDPDFCISCTWPEGTPTYHGDNGG
jgi:hypothetical protein